MDESRFGEPDRTLPEELQTGASGVRPDDLASLSAKLGLEVVGRHKSPYFSSFPTEVLTCRTPRGEIERIFLKHQPAGHPEAVSTGLSHRRGLEYEAAVYSRILGPLQAPVPSYYGLYADGAAAGLVLAIQHLDGAARAAELDSGPEAAARWLGEFHSRAGREISESGMAWLITHDFLFHWKWVSQACGKLRQWGVSAPWLERLATSFPAIYEAVAETVRTIIHGEFYPKNILVREGQAYVVDWQSAAVGMGCIDLASLTEGWPLQVVEKCVGAYCETRWHDAAPPAILPAQLAYGRLYWASRWLSSALNPERYALRVDTLKAAAQELDTVL